MKFALFCLFVFFFATTLMGQAVIVNEVSQGSSGNKEWVELVVVDNGVDLRGWELGDNDDGNWHSIVEFTNNSNWSNVPMGTIIVIYNSGDVDGQITSAGGQDTDFSDKVVIIPENNNTYFTDTGGWPGSGVFGNTDRDDCPALRDNNDVMVHDMAVTHPSATVGSPSSGKVKYYTSNSAAGTANNSNWTEAASTAGTPGSGNGGDNSTWIDQALPITLSSFTVRILGSKIELRWTTESEIDNVGFEIVRSFEKEGNYQTIATYLNNPELKGQGNSSARTHYSFTDVTVAPGNTYWYKLVDVDNNGNRTFHGPISITLKKGVHPISETFPNNFKLYANYPNPFNPSTTLRFDIPKLSSGVIHADLIIYNSLGEIVSVLHKGAIAPGSYEVIWDGTDSAGNLLPSGIYYAQIHADFYRQTVKMVMLK